MNAWPMHVFAFMCAIIFLFSCGGDLRKTRSGDDHENPRISYLRRAMEKRHRIHCGDEGCSSAANRVCVDELGKFGASADFEMWDGRYTQSHDEATFNCIDSPAKREAARRIALKVERAGIRTYNGPLDDADDVAHAMLHSCQQDEQQGGQEIAVVERHDERRFRCRYERYPFESSPKGMAPCMDGAALSESCLAYPRVLDCASTADCHNRAQEWCQKSSSELHKEWVLDLLSVEEFSRSFEGIEYIHDVRFRCRKEVIVPFFPGSRAHSGRSQESERVPSASTSAYDAFLDPESSENADFKEPSGRVDCQIEQPYDYTYTGRNPNIGKGSADIDHPELIGRSLRPKDGKGIEIFWTYSARSEGSRSDDVIKVHVHDTTADHHMKFRLDIRAYGADGRLLHRQKKVDFDLSPGEQESARVPIPYPNGKVAGDDVAQLVVTFVKLKCYVPVYHGPFLQPVPPRFEVGPGVN